MADLKEFLASKQIENIYAVYQEELLGYYKKPLVNIARKWLGGKNSHQKPLTPKAAELGLLLINVPVGKETQDSGSASRGINSYSDPHQTQVRFNDARYLRIVDLLGKKVWDDSSNRALLEYFFGEPKAKYIIDAWNKIPGEIYQTGFTRRSFRAPHIAQLYRVAQINFLINAIPQSHTFAYSTGKGYLRTYYDFSLREQVRFSHLAGNSGNQALSKLWAAALDAGDEELYKTFEAIIYQQDEVGKVTHDVVKALLSCNRKDAWELVEKLLLSAQRQEGLRQTILESLDESSVGALKYIIKVLLEHKLTRFSSVVRAVDVWVGLGWEAARESTVRQFLEKADYYLSNPQEIPAAMDLADNSNVSMALWAQGVFDVEKTSPLLERLMQNADASKRCLAILFAFQSRLNKLQLQTVLKGFADTNETVSAFAAGYVPIAIKGTGEKYFCQQYPNFFDAVEKRYMTTEFKEKVLDGVVFSWNKSTSARRDLLSILISLVGENKKRLETVLGYFEEMNAAQRHLLSEIILPQYCARLYSTGIKSSEKKTQLSKFQREYALRILSDRTEFTTACKALSETKLSLAEAAILPNLLKRKSSDFRGKVLSLVLKQNENTIAHLVDELMIGNQEQSLAALEIISQLKKNQKMPTAVSSWMQQFQDKKSVTEQEKRLLQLSDENTVLNAENGYGLYDPSTLPPIVKPVADKNSYYESCLAENRYGFSLPLDKIQKAMQKLDELLQQNIDYEYEIETWGNEKQTVLLGNIFRQKNRHDQVLPPQEQYAAYPLHEVWKQWYLDCQLAPRDLFLLGAAFELSARKLRDFEGKLSSAEDVENETIPDLVKIFRSDKSLEEKQFHEIIKALFLIFPFAEKNSFCIGASQHLFSLLDEKVLQWKPEERQFYHGPTGWQQVKRLNFFLDSLDLNNIDNESIHDIWNLYHWRQYGGLKANSRYSVPPLQVFAKAYEAQIIGEDQLIRGMLTKEGIQALSSKKMFPVYKDIVDKYPFVPTLFKSTLDKILDVELKRGDLATPVTSFAKHIKTVYGASRFAEILAGMAKMTLHKGYFYIYGESAISKRELLSYYLQNCYPEASDTQEIFTRAINQFHIGEKQLLGAAMYAPQWQKYVSEYLGWEGLNSAVWWFHAHTKNSSYKPLNADFESEIARFSSINTNEFATGAVDIEWFKSAYKTIGKQRWIQLYDAAKYITDGNGHRRARIYTDVLLGSLKIREVVARIQKTRDQEYVRVYGLVPLSKTNPQKDMLNRYEFLQQFRKESKQFGSQKQSSEQIAYQVAMDNLARNAGYPDPQRFSWAMESKQVQEVLSKETSIQFADTLIQLIIDDTGNAEVLSFKDEKPLKAIPAKYKKDKKVMELLTFRKTLRTQFSRSRKSLEEAMVRGDIFALKELKVLFDHPVIRHHLKNLVFVAERNGEVTAHGFFHADQLIAADKTEYALPENAALRIAHCTDLQQTKQWSAYQRHLFDENTRQPFKQIFRELYLPTADELQEKSISRRYAGHQVQPQKTVALLKTRGWKIDYEEGLQKVFHREGFRVELYALADWFTPADVEQPTLETIRFFDLKTHEPVAFVDIDKRIFSEVMRDVDLVVSVAHVGGVDPECSHSTIEMRQALLGESLRLFKISNVEIANNHAIIQGKMGKYSIHLGSAVVHQIGQGYLSIIPVHSQHRGRIFLPFADDDPKSAELISKVLLLANDEKIQDPTVLRQIRVDI
jgi:hypothetical protein